MKEDVCRGSGMLVSLADPEQTRVGCPECGAKGLVRAALVNGFGKVPEHPPQPQRSLGVRVAPPSDFRAVIADAMSAAGLGEDGEKR